GRQFVIQKARHDQKVYALPFSCQLVRPGRRSLTYAQPATFPLLVQRCQIALRHVLLFHVTLLVLAGFR
ncbi:hypothetical protein, partial [Collinsella aerofaciens]|uniref:hypothetical protein n=1 Tax=Collinsella aerofaciens TaxID=74426 RepID=UPI00325A6963